VSSLVYDSTAAAVCYQAASFCNLDLNMLLPPVLWLLLCPLLLLPLNWRLDLLSHTYRHNGE
jgi:hypothetical protein